MSRKSDRLRVTSVKSKASAVAAIKRSRSARGTFPSKEGASLGETKTDNRGKRKESKRCDVSMEIGDRGRRVCSVECAFVKFGEGDDADGAARLANVGQARSG